MARRKSKSDRRRLRYKIEQSRRIQPGYDYINNLHASYKAAAETKISESLQETTQQIGTILRDSTLMKFSFAWQERSWVLKELIFDNSLIALITIVAAALFDWKSSLTILLASISILVIVDRITDKIIAAKVSLHAEQIEAIKIAHEDLKLCLLSEVKENYRISCDEFNGYPPDWFERRREVLKRDDYSCRICCKKYTQPRLDKLHIHHIVEISRGGTNHMDNLLTLCNSCHSRVHGEQ